MITITFALTVGIGGYCVSAYGADLGLGWSIFFGILAFGVCQGVMGYVLQKRVKREMEAVQNILLAGQGKLQQKMQRWQFRPPGSIQAAQKEVFEDTKIFVREAMKQTETLNKYRLWIPMMDRQIATAKIQLSWMIKDYKTVDALLPKAILLDPTMAAMKMARLQMLDKPLDEIRKIYKKGVARVRYNGNVLLAATMSWIEVKRGETDAAFKTLTEALKKSDNEVLKHNHETLMNNRVAHFTNSGLGDSWYALLLEEPKYHTQKARNVYR